LLSLGEDAKLTFHEVGKDRWLESVRHTLAPATVVQREIRIKNIAPFFSGKPLRNITPADCEKWVV
ncbi:MAG: N-terminal phage integrase SAM-like domain-containing protein, partial [Verrucomicrobia bacterium]|nr:N-terminal phage integrase SAM-like domain-containing protein [Verrucomicrobiota bacterium]